MKYYSTNKKAPIADLHKAVVKGLAEDRGLYMPEIIKKLPQDFFDNIEKLSFQEIAYKVADAFFGEDVDAESLKKIVSVTDKGKITGNKVGEAVIKIKLRSGLTARFTVKVQKGAVRISSFKIFNKVTDKKIQKTVRMKVGEKLTLSAAAVPVTSKPQFTYSSSNEKIASVNSKGVITARKKGKAVITVECGKKAAKFKIEVVKR